MRKRLLVIAAIAVIVGALAWWFLHVSDADEPQTTLTAPAVAPAKPVAGDAITITGELPTRFKREAKLQTRSDKGWKTVGTRDSDSDGDVEFKTTMPNDTVEIRVVADEAVYKRKRYVARTTPGVTITAVAVDTSLTILPPIGQDGDKTDLTPVTATFDPARPGDSVRLQSSAKSNSWADVATAKQDKAGTATFMVEDVKPTAKLRVVMGADDAIESRAQSPSYAHLSFKDDFNGSRMNQDAANGWHHRYVGVLSINMGRICSESSPNSVSVSRGSLILQTLQTPGKSTPACAAELAKTYKKVKKPVGSPSGRIMTNGHVSTITAENPGGFQFRYGVAAARIKFAKNRGQHGSFWMQPANKQPGTEVDIIEYFGDDFSRGGLTHALYYKKNGVSQKAGTLPEVGDLSSIYGNDDWWKDYHVYSVEWTPAEYIFRVDGKETWRSKKGVSQAPAYLILSLLSSDWELPSLPRDDVKGNTMGIDWVKVWQNQ